MSKPPSKAAAGDAITFRCQNGHRIDVPATLAGKRGTCSKCGIPVVIPASKPAAPPVPAVLVPGAEPRPPALEVRPVQEISPDPFANLFESQAVPVNAGPIAADLDEAFAQQEPTADQSGVGEVLANAEQKTYPDLVEVAGADNPTAQLVARLWAERDHGGVVELHIAGGSVILPEWYEANWSRGTHGLFASQAADGTVTLAAVAWDSIQKIVVRQVEGLPDGMFE